MDSLTRIAELTILLVHAHLPALLRKGEAGSQPRNAGAGDLYRGFHTPNSIGALSCATV